eukprot:403337269
MANAYMIAHGGAISYLLDMINSVGICALTGEWPFTLKFNLDYLNQVQLETEYEASITITKKTKKVAFTMIELYEINKDSSDDKTQGKLLVQASAVNLLTATGQVKL